MTIVLGTACGAAPAERGPALDSSPCQLPIGSTIPGVGGFLSYPGGQFSSDGTSALSYSAKHQRWLPVPHQFISPDGDSYLRLDFSKTSRVTSLNAVDIATGNERPLGGLGSSAAPLVWSMSGIYFLQFARPQPELWVLDPAKQTSRMVAVGSNGLGLPIFKAWTGVGGGAAWSKTVENTAGPAGDILVRVDLASGQAEVWYRQNTPTTLDVLGFGPEGDPLVTVVSGGGNRILLLTGPRRSNAIESRDFRPGAPGAGTGISDSHGLWLLANDGGVWLYRDRIVRPIGSAKLPPSVSPASDIGPARPNLLIAGPCA